MRVQRVTNVTGTKPAKKPTVIIQELLDASGSMGYGSKPWSNTKYGSSVDGINEEINILKGDKTANYLFGVSEFDARDNGKWGKDHGNTMKLNEAVVIKDIVDVATFEGQGPFGGTPLYEAIAITIQNLLALKRDEDRVLLKIFTDGDENMSQNGWGRLEGGAKKLFDLIEKVKKESKFTVTFIGTPHDTESVIKNLGIDVGNTFTYDGTARGAKMSMRHATGQTMAFVADVAERGIETSSTFYTKTVNKD